MTHSSSRAGGFPVDSVLLDLVDRGLVSADALGRPAGGDARDAPLVGVAEAEARLEALSGRPRFVSACGVRNLVALNQLYGARVGDAAMKVLRAVVPAVFAEADPGALVARTQGPDVLVVHGTDDRAAAEAVARRLRDVLVHVALPAGQGLVHLRPFVATVEVAAATRSSADELLRALQDARARAHRSDDGLALLGAAEAEGVLTRLRTRDARLAWVTEALEGGRVEAHFQPVVDLRSGEIHDVEVLARIRTPEGLLTASEFIDDVHALGETALLDTHVMRRVGADARELSRVTGRLFVNVSPLSLGSPGFLEVMAETIARLRDEGLRLVLVLELTEQALLEHHDVIREIHRVHGVTFAVDDFGTGYSSLRTVSDLAVGRVISVLKVDGSLTRRIAESTEAYKVVLAVAHLARSLDLRVVAEHVETVEVLERLRTTGIECGQGFLFDPALPAEELLARRSERRAVAEPPVRPHLHLLEPYLHRAFEGFYERLLSDPHLARHFRGDAQVRRLVEKQKATFVASLEDDAEGLRERYSRLGRRHAELAIPLATFLEGADILHQQLLDVLVHASRDVSVLRDTERFFAGLKDEMARGYLSSWAPDLLEELRALGEWAVSAADLPEAGLTAVRSCAESVLRPLLARGSGVRAVAPASGCPLAPLVAETPAAPLHGELHGDAASLAWTLGQGRAAAAASVVQALVGRFQRLAIALAQKGPAGTL